MIRSRALFIPNSIELVEQSIFVDKRSGFETIIRLCVFSTKACALMLFYVNVTHECGWHRAEKYVR